MTPQLPDLAGVRHRDLTLPTGVRLHVAEAGPEDGTPVLCLHGWPQHWWIWRHAIRTLSDEYRVICPDNRGAGWSGWPEDGDFRKQRLADDAVALLDALGVDRAHVIGHDWGAWAAMLLGIGSPGRLRSLLATSIVHPWIPPARAARNIWRFAYQLPLATPVLSERLQRRPDFARRVLRSGWHNRDAWDEGAAASYGAALAQPDNARAGHRMYRQFVLQEFGPGLAGGFGGKRLGVPSRLLIGRHDPLGAELGQGFERHGDDASWEIVEGSGHFLPEERPEALLSHARELLTAA
jgi:pimeloyl-ACP methyl ester carboxylesterase